MIINSKKIFKDPESIKTGNLRRPYFKPSLEDLGDLRALTLGPSLGQIDDSPTDTYPMKSY